MIRRCTFKGPLKRNLRAVLETAKWADVNGASWWEKSGLHQHHFLWLVRQPNSSPQLGPAVVQYCFRTKREEMAQVQ